MISERQEDLNSQLWRNWILLKKSQNVNFGFQLKKQGVSDKKTDQAHEFSYRSSYSSPPSVQEFYEAILNGIMKRCQLQLYEGKAVYYEELQHCFSEFSKLLSFRSEILVEVFQSITKLNLSKEPQNKIVVNCGNCGVYILTNYHCRQCLNQFYCDKTCLRSHALRHSQDCQAFRRTSPRIMYPLQVEIHCGSDLGDNLQIYYQHQRRLTLRERGRLFLKGIQTVLSKNRWLKNNEYTVVEEGGCLRVETKERGEKEKEAEQREGLTLDDLFEMYLKMAVVQEMRMVFLNQGAILQDCVKEKYNNHIHLVLVYYFPI